VMEATSFRLGGAGQAHASEPNSYWMSFPFAVAAVWAATRARPVCWFRREGIRRHNRFLQELRADRVAADGGDGAGHFVDARFRLPHSQRIHPTTQARSNRRRTGLRSQRHRKGDRGETGRTGYRMHTSKNRPRWPYAIVGFHMMGRRHHVTMPDAAGMSDEPTHRERSGMPLGSQIRQSTRRNNGDDVGGIRLV
jgi:hypothetical protein